MCKKTILYADCYRKNLTLKTDTRKQIIVKEYISVVYETLIEKGLKVRIIREFNNGMEEVSRQETNFDDISDDISYSLEIDNLAESDITLSNWNNFLQSLGAEVGRY